ncbi:sigma factor-like helix-turn-helix DNA-binding protein [Kitasatospora aureofaciens]|uniref:sigma factor-like helix-turn-helix DNA-binding protein n=1 Tax=Kitasatospora aureofaciens TaxID=1894 RepID=UPI0033A5DAEA
MSPAALHQELETFRNGQGGEALEQIQRLVLENGQLRLGVAQLIRRVDEADQALRAMTRERDEARQQNAALSRALARFQERGKASVKQVEGEPGPIPPPATDGGRAIAGESEGQTAGEPGQAGADPTDRVPRQQQPRNDFPSSERMLQLAGVAAGEGASGALRPSTTPRSKSGASADAALAADLPVAFEAFYLANASRYQEYAQAQLGSEQAAQGVVEDTFAFIAMNWQQFLGQERPAAWAWTILRDGVMEQVTMAAAKRATVTRVLQGARTTLEATDSELGLYAAISVLPERQFDVIVLRYVLGYSDDVISDLLGISYSAVRVHAVRARRRLAGALEARNSLSKPRPDPAPKITLRDSRGPNGTVAEAQN